MKGDWDGVPNGAYYVVSAKRYLRKALTNGETFVTFGDISVIDYRETFHPMRNVVYAKVRQQPGRLYKIERLEARLELKVTVYNEVSVEVVPDKKEKT